MAAQRASDSSTLRSTKKLRRQEAPHSPLRLSPGDVLTSPLGESHQLCACPGAGAGYLDGQDLARGSRSLLVVGPPWGWWVKGRAVAMGFPLSSEPFPAPAGGG